MTGLRGVNQKGDCLYRSTPFGRWRTQTLIAGLTSEGIIALSPGHGPGGVFVYVESELKLELEPGTVVILDNLATYICADAAGILQAHGCWLLFLPPYSPDLNPIEFSFYKIKSHLRQIRARTFDQFSESIVDICDLYKPIRCLNFYEAIGYKSY